MKIINKITALILSLSMLSIFAPCIYAATESGTCGANLTWTLNDDGILTISGKGAMSDYSEDSEPPWQSDKWYIKGIVIKDGVTSIGDYAFSECEDLASVIIPDSVASIGKHAFEYCEYLSSVILPDSVKSVGDMAFYFSGIKMVYFGKGITTLGFDAFFADVERVYYSGTEEEWNKVVYPDDGYYSELAEVPTIYGSTMPKLPKSGIIAGGICGDSAVWTIDESNTLNINGSGEILCAELGTFAMDYLRESWDMFYPNPNKVVIGEGITKIGDYGFNNCQHIESISLPNSLIELGEDAFNMCYGLTNIKISKNVTKIGIGAFACNSGELDIIMDSANPNYTVESGALLSKDKKRLLAYTKDKIAPEYVVPSSVEIIENEAFDGCGELTSVTLPQGLKSIGSRAFALCYGLTEIEIPGSVQIISPGAFSACSELNISVNDSNRNYSSIDGVLFSKDEKRLIAYTKDWIVPDYTVPSGVERIENQAFASCRYLKSVEIPTGVTEIGRQAFSACTEMTQVNLPYTLELVEKGAFNSTRNLTDVYYDGSYAEWDHIDLNDYNLENIAWTEKFHCNTREYSVNYGYINGRNKVRIGIRKEDENAADGILIAVSYASDRKIIDTAFTEIGGLSTHSNETMDIDLKTEGAKLVRAFIWDGKDKLRPMSRYIKFTMD